MPTTNADADRTTESLVPAATSIVEASDARGKPRVLCIDDDVTLLSGLRRTLSQEFSITLADSPEKALELFENTGPFAVVMSDFKMPGMTGIEVLTRAREIDPLASRILLTGQAEDDTAVQAINTGQIFRFLNKPIAGPELHAAIAAAVEQHRLLIGERTLLEDTLRGSIRALVDVLSLANPAAFARTVRIRDLVTEMLSLLDIANSWEIEVAAVLSQTGVVTLPADVLSKLSAGHHLTSVESDMVDQMPAVSAQLIEGIPRLENVREIIRAHARVGEPGSTVGDGRIGLAAELLRLAVEYDTAKARGLGWAEIAEGLSSVHPFDETLLIALRSMADQQSALQVAESLPIPMLEPGMMLARDVWTDEDTLLVGHGLSITRSIIERLRNYHRQGAIPGKVHVWR